MGCHTWIYKKATLLNADQRKQIVENAKQHVNALADYTSFEDYKETMQPFYADEVEQYKQEHVHTSVDDFETDEDKATYQELVDLMGQWEELATSDEALRQEYEDLIRKKKDATDIFNGDVDAAYMWIASNLWKNDIIEDFSGASYEFHNGELYICIMVDPFRVYKYDVEFTDEQSLLQYLMSLNDEQYGYYDYKESKFIVGHNQTLKDKISDIFSHNEEGSLLVQFG